jgi:hypothetical protein
MAPLRMSSTKGLISSQFKLFQFIYVSIEFVKGCNDRPDKVIAGMSVPIKTGYPNPFVVIAIAQVVNS